MFYKMIENKCTQWYESEKPVSHCRILKNARQWQIVIPSKARKLFQIESGDNLIVLGDELQGIAIIKEERFLAMANEIRKAEETWQARDDR